MDPLNDTPRPSHRVILALGAAVLGFFAGMVIGGRMVPKDAGLAGGASVFFYGLVGLAVCVVAAVVVSGRLKRAVARRLALIVGAIAVAFTGWLVWRMASELNKAYEQDREERERLRNMRPTPVLFASFGGSHHATDIIPDDQQSDRPMGMGMAAPRIAPGVLRFFSLPDLPSTPDLPPVTDSIVLVQGEYHVEIAYAPPWFVPAHLKLDYGLLLLRAVTVSQEWIEVEVSMHDGRTAWVHRDDVWLRLWPEFIIGMVAVETHDPEANPIRLKPLDHASVLADGAGALLRPLAVQGDWLMVSTSGLADRIVPTGWIRWREGERLLVEYSLLC